MPNAVSAAAASISGGGSIQHCLHVPRRSVTASDDTWRIEMKCAFLGPTATRRCSCYVQSFPRIVLGCGHEVSWLKHQLCYQK